MALTNIKKELQKLEKSKLIDLVADLYKKNKSVKEFFDFYVNPKENDLLIKYQDKIFLAFYPKNGYECKLKEARKAISDFKNLGVLQEYLAEIMLFYVETGVKYTNDYGDINESFYESIEKMFVKTLTTMRNGELLEQFEMRSSLVARNSEDIGWGFHDSISDIFYEFYEKEYEKLVGSKENPKK